MWGPASSVPRGPLFNHTMYSFSESVDYWCRRPCVLLSHLVFQLPFKSLLYYCLPLGCSFPLLFDYRVGLPINSHTSSVFTETLTIITDSTPARTRDNHVFLIQGYSSRADSALHRDALSTCFFTSHSWSSIVRF